MARRTLPKGWKEVELGSILNRIKRPVDLNASTVYREIGIRSHGKGIFYKEERTGKSIGEKSVFWIEPNCFIVNIVFAWEQAIAKTTINEKGMIASHRFPMYKPAQGELNLDYLVYFFNSPRGKYLLGLASPGGAGRNKTLGQHEFLKLRIPLPPYNEQCKIVEYLSTWDKAIALMEKSIIAKQQFKKGIMQKLLTGKFHITNKDENWREYKLEEVCTDFLNGGTPSTAMEEYWTGKIPWITGSDFGELRIKNVRKFITKDAVKNSTTNIIPKDNILVVTRVGVGKLAIAPFDIAISQDTTGLIPNRKIITPDFMLYALALTIPHLIKFNQGTSIQGITRKKLIKHKILVPSLTVQHKISKILRTVFEEVDLLIKKQDLYKKQKKGLMQKLLTGQVRVKV